MSRFLLPELHAPLDIERAQAKFLAQLAAENARWSLSCATCGTTKDVAQYPGISGQVSLCVPCAAWNGVGASYND